LLHLGRLRNPSRKFLKIIGKIAGSCTFFHHQWRPRVPYQWFSATAGPLLSGNGPWWFSIVSCHSDLLIAAAGAYSSSSVAAIVAVKLLLESLFRLHCSLSPSLYSVLFSWFSSASAAAGESCLSCCHLLTRSALIFYCLLMTALDL